MRTFNYDNLAANLPDAFIKDENSNNYKILQVEKYIYTAIEKIFRDIFEILDINNATGATLDRYGAKYNVKRGTLDDIKYLIKVKSKSTQSLSDGSRDSIAKSLANTLMGDTSQVKMTNGKDNYTVDVLGIPLTLLIEAGYTTQEINQLIEVLLSEGITLNSTLYEGTFEFGDTANEYDETAGFADIDGTIGGFFGLLGG